ncbi:hypothetical protein K438DRAFT_1851411 [Mycena galopus ATCC 62051]|nr:hypothetical protein K438DRAFT_1851411 [Mycena galopus ATCC 62051]
MSTVGTWQASPTIAHLPNEILAEIFILALLSNSGVPYTSFPSPTFVVPAATAPPLLLCAVSTCWRAIAIGDPQLWTSLNAEHVQHSQLLWTWLLRALGLPLCLRVAQPLGTYADLRTIRPAPALLEEHSYTGAPHHPLLLLAQISHCRHIAMINLMIPPFIEPIPSPTLQSLSAVVHPENVPAVEWFSRPMALAPHLTSLHWAGPVVAAPWAQLTHLSLDLGRFSPLDFKQVMDAVMEGQNVYHFPHPSHTLPSITTFNFSGETALLRFLALPNLTHLVIEWVTQMADWDGLAAFLDCSGCTITVLELWESVRWGSYFPRMLLALLVSPAIAASLTWLLISSRDLNEFFLWLERCTSGTLPPALVLLHNIDRCFQIDNLLGITDASAFGLYLDDNEDAQECCIVGSVPSTAFTLWRSIALRREYKSWWHSEQGSAFQAARAANDLGAVLEFDIDWAQLLHDPDDDQRAKQNRFASVQ